MGDLVRTRPEVGTQMSPRDFVGDLGPSHAANVIVSSSPRARVLPGGLGVDSLARASSFASPSSNARRETAETAYLA